MRLRTALVRGSLLLHVAAALGCSSEGTDAAGGAGAGDGGDGGDGNRAAGGDGADTDGTTDAGTSGGSGDQRPAADIQGFPTGTECSWNGRWQPGADDFPIEGLSDAEYPELPPGEWDWDDGSDDKANWRNFETNLGTFETVTDDEGRQCGWRMVPKAKPADFAAAAEYYEGSAGADIVDLGADGVIHSLGVSTKGLGAGPDVLVFQRSYSLDYRTGSSETGAFQDDDLVVAGCGDNGDASFDIETTTIHTGPGSDWVFIRDWDRAAVDLGNGANGRTDTIDPNDGDDLAVLRGNSHDFRVFGGAGSDTIVWYIDDNIQATEWLGPNLFGDGGRGEALWGDPDSTDRLVLAVPDDTGLVKSTPTPPGNLLVLPVDDRFVDDPPTAADPFAYYCVLCGTGPQGERTVQMEYRSQDDSVLTGYFGVTGFEELQVGVGPAARVFAIDNGDGALTELADATPTVPPSWPTQYCE